MSPTKLFKVRNWEKIMDKEAKKTDNKLAVLRLSIYLFIEDLQGGK